MNLESPRTPRVNERQPNRELTPAERELVRATAPSGITATSMASLYKRRSRSGVFVVSLLLGFATARTVFPQQNVVGGGAAMMIDSFVFAMVWMAVLEWLTRKWRTRKFGAESTSTPEH